MHVTVYYPKEFWDGDCEDCLWYILAQACYEWINVRTQRLAYVKLHLDGRLTVCHRPEFDQGCDEFTYFECLLKRSGALLSFIVLV